MRSVQSQLLFVLICIALLSPASAQENRTLIRFENMSLGMGFNRTDYTILFPESSATFNNDNKQSLLIDLRINFEVLEKAIVSTAFQFWSWSDNSGAREDIPQTGMNDFAFLFDVIRYFPLKEKTELLAGAGAGIHMLALWTNFPFDPPYYEAGTLNQLREIIEHKNIVTPDVLTGLRYRVSDKIYVSTEARYEFARELRQWKYLVTISLF